MYPLSVITAQSPIWSQSRNTSFSIREPHMSYSASAFLGEWVFLLIPEKIVCTRSWGQHEMTEEIT